MENKPYFYSGGFSIRKICLKFRNPNNPKKEFLHNFALFLVVFQDLLSKFP